MDRIYEEEFPMNIYGEEIKMIVWAYWSIGSPYRQEFTEYYIKIANGVWVPQK